MARPKKDIDEQTVEDLAAIMCSYAEIASIVKCDPSTLTRRFAQAIEAGRNRGKVSLKRKQFEVAMSGGPGNTGHYGMLIWLGKIWLEQREPKEISPDQMSESTAQVIAEQLKRLNETRNRDNQDQISTIPL